MQLQPRVDEPLASLLLLLPLARRSGWQLCGLRAEQLLLRVVARITGQKGGEGRWRREPQLGAEAVADPQRRAERAGDGALDVHNVVLRELEWRDGITSGIASSSIGIA